MSRRALVAGATGLVGRALLAQLREAPEYEQVTALVRRPLALSHPRLRTQVVDLAALDALPADPCDDAFCALGTTFRAAGSEAEFARVDRDLVVAFARHARRCGARRFMMVSALGADPGSRVFYNRTKGEAERAVAALGFDAVHLFRPSFLLGSRQESRPGEYLGKQLARVVAPLLIGSLRRYRPVHADAVAHALIVAATSDARGVVVHHFHER